MVAPLTLERTVAPSSAPAQPGTASFRTRPAVDVAKTPVRDAGGEACRHLGQVDGGRHRGRRESRAQQNARARGTEPHAQRAVDERGRKAGEREQQQFTHASPRIPHQVRSRALSGRWDISTSELKDGAHLRASYGACLTVEPHSPNAPVALRGVSDRWRCFVTPHHAAGRRPRRPPLPLGFRTHLQRQPIGATIMASRAAPPGASLVPRTRHSGLEDAPCTSHPSRPCSCGSRTSGTRETKRQSTRCSTSTARSTDSARPTVSRYADPRASSRSTGRFVAPCRTSPSPSSTHWSTVSSRWPIAG